MPDREIRRPGWRGYLPRRVGQIGRRGAMLLVFGVLWMVVGVGVLDSSGVHAELLHERLPSWVRGGVWVVTGALAVFYAFRPPGLSDRVGFASLYIMPAVRVLSYTMAWIDYFIPIGGDGYASGWRFAAVYAVMLAAVMITAGWPEPTRTPRPSDFDGEDG